MPISIKLKPAAERMVKKGHPWVFDQSIVRQSAEGEAGDLAIIYDQRKNKFLACGLYDPYSPIRIRVLQVHQPATIGGEWFARKIREALGVRVPLMATDTNSYRLIYGENDGLPGLIADIYNNVLVIKLYAHCWFSWLPIVVPELVAAAQAEVAVLRLNRLLQQKRHSDYTDGQVIHGQLSEEDVTFKEHGLWFKANVVKGHKTGFFLDHRHNRQRIGELASGKTVLDVFAYAGGFSVHALAGGATAVTSLDISQEALRMAQENVALNDFTGTHHIMAADAFEGLATLRQQNRQFDIVIIDPPSFAKKADELAVAKKQYSKLAVLGAASVKKGGMLLLASCSSRLSAPAFYDLVLQTLKEAGCGFTILTKTEHDIDHPVRIPEGAYLKSIYLVIKGHP